MAPLGHSVLWVARDRAGVPIGFHNDMYFGKGAWYHTGCSTQAALENGANYLLFWEALRGAKASGRRYYDCGEVFPDAGQGKSKGLTFFKTRFGGTARPFVKVVKAYAMVDQRSPAKPTAKEFVRNLAQTAKVAVGRLKFNLSGASAEGRD